MSLLKKLIALFNIESAKSEKGTVDAVDGIAISFTSATYTPRHERTNPRGVSRQFSASSRDVLLGEFSIVDIETTGLSAERDTILEIAAINVGPGFQIVAEFSTLVKCGIWIPHHIVELTGLTQTDVNSFGVPLSNAMAAFVAHVANRPVFAHNAPFDFGFLIKAAGKCGIPFDNAAHDSIHVAREAWPNLQSYKLSALAEQLGLAHAPTHRALDDVKATLALLRAAHETFEGSRHPMAPIHRYKDFVRASSIARPGNTSGVLYGEFVVFTGELSTSRERAADSAALAGCTVTLSVTKKTTMLVVGTQDLATLAGFEKSSKHRKAEELIGKGQRIRILTETDFLVLVN